MGLSFVCAAGSCQRSLSRFLVPWDWRPYFTLSDLRLSFSSPPTTRRVTVDVFDPATTRVFRLLSSLTLTHFCRNSYLKTYLVGPDTEHLASPFFSHRNDIVASETSVLLAHCTAVDLFSVQLTVAWVQQWDVFVTPDISVPLRHCVVMVQYFRFRIAVTIRVRELVTMYTIYVYRASVSPG
jgi:hypothetical protein